MPSIYDLPTERRLQLLVEAVVDYAIFLLDPEGLIATWNTGAERIKGYSANEIVGSNFSLFYIPEDRQRGVPQAALKMASERGKYEAEGWRLRKDGTRFWASVVIDAIRSEQGDLLGFAKVTRDITERKQTEEQLLHVREQLLQSQKLESIGRLTGGIAHDFNNLLTVILSGSQMIERLAQGNDQMLRLLGHIRHAVERGEKLTRQLLTYSRRQALKPQLLDISATIPPFAESILPTLRGDIELEIDIADDLWPVEADASELDLALINLALNARDAMPKGGRLRICARNDIVSPNGEGSPGRYVGISISDNGIGMTPEILAKATEPFFTTKASGSGTGLGLSQAFGFAKQSGGSLQIDSVLGKGTTVTIYLPAVQSAASESRPTSRGRGLTVLIVEDELLVAEVAKSILSQAGYAVEVAHSATSGLDIVRSSKIDAVFSDIVMPGGMNGLDLAEQIRSEHPKIPILLTTGYYHLPQSRNIRHSVLKKPYDEATLLSALERLLS